MTGQHSFGDTPYDPPATPRRRHRVDQRLRRALPRPAYELLLDGYHGLRKLARRNPGRGRVLPDFVIIGAAKAGTTSLFGWLDDRADVRASWRKEINFFSYHYYRGEDWYRQHFPLETERAAFAREHGRPFSTFEASPSYLFHPRAPERMARMLPDVKLIVQLRDPVDRAYSHFRMRQRDGEEPLESFAAAVEAEDGRVARGWARMVEGRDFVYAVACWGYLMRSRYAEQIVRWFEHFPRQQFHFMTLEQLASEPQPVLDGLTEFLGLPPGDGAAFRARFAFDYEPLPTETRRLLDDYFRPHNERLYELLGVDLGWERRATVTTARAPQPPAS